MFRKSFMAAVSSVAACCATASGASITVGNTDTQNQGLINDLLNPTNAADFGITSASLATAAPLGGGVTSSYLDGVDIFFTGRSGIGQSPTASEILALIDFVNGGGDLIINNDRTDPGGFLTLEPLMQAFGVSLIREPTANVEALNILDQSHPVIDGPFGAVSSVGLRDASRFDVSGGDAEAVLSWQDGDVALAVLRANPNVGRLGTVVFLPDVECFLLINSNCSLGSGDYGVASRNAIALALNDNAPSPVPAPGAALLAGPALVGLMLRRRKQK